MIGTLKCDALCIAIVRMMDCGEIVRSSSLEIGNI